MKAAKFVVGLVTAVLVALSQLTLTGQAEQWVTIALSIVGALAVYLTPNAPAVTPPADGSVRR